MAQVDKNKIKICQTNKKAYFNYIILEEIECGISLQGTEVKSIRQNKFSFGDSYGRISNGSLFLVGFTIQSYNHGGTIFNHVIDQERRLLVHKSEIKRLKRKVEQKGLTLVPTKVYFKGNLIKIQISLCKGKNVRDKKDTIKERDLDRQLKRDARNSYKY